MAAPALLSSTTVVPVSPEVAYDGILAAPLEEIFTERAGLLPPIARTEGQTGAWGTVGQTRTVVLGDGSRSLETLVAADRAVPDYRYRISDLTGPFRLLVSGIEGRFAFEPEPGGTRVTWSWALHPRNAATRPLLGVVGFFWQRWAAAMWPRYAARL